jgi:hypothetical protein
MQREERCMRSFRIVFIFTKYNQDDQLKDDKIGGPCIRHESDEKYETPEAKRPVGRPRSK